MTLGQHNDTPVLYTVGHSTHDIVTFLHLLRTHQVTAVADVRSSPFSRSSPQFIRDVLRRYLSVAGIKYVFLGKELGGRSNDPADYLGGKVQYKRLEQRPQFAQGLERIRLGMTQYRIALLCAEREPLECHRTILVCRHLRRENLAIRHILADGTAEEHERTEARLLKAVGAPNHEMFVSPDVMIERAYDIQSERIAYAQFRPVIGSNHPPVW